MMSTPKGKPKNPEDESIWTLFIGGVKQILTKSEIKEYFENFGKVKQVKILLNAECAFVEFEDRKFAELAFDKSYKTCMISKIPLKVLWAKKEPSKAAPLPPALKWLHPDI